MITRLYRCGINRTGYTFLQYVLADPEIAPFSKGAVQEGFLPEVKHVQGKTTDRAFHEKFLRCRSPRHLHQHAEPEGNWRALCIQRDPRDFVFSHYFSVRFSHYLMTEQMATIRQFLNSVSFMQGVECIMVLQQHYGIFQDMRDWHSLQDARILTLTTEDLFEDPIAFMKKLFVHLDIEVPEKTIASTIERIQNGVKNANQKISIPFFRHHRTQGHGDFRNYLTDKLATRMKACWGDLVSLLGYEQDESWEACITQKELNILETQLTPAALLKQLETPKEKAGFEKIMFPLGKAFN